MRIVVYLAVLVFSICASTNTVARGKQNASTFPYEINEELQDREQYKRFIVAPVNLGKPSRNYLQEHEAKIDKEVTRYLKSNGYELADPALFTAAWEDGIRRFGEPFNPTTGRLNERSFQANLASSITALKENHDIDAVIFTNLEEHQVMFSPGMSHIARFHGVSRKPSMQGPGQGISGEFSWIQDVDAVSLFVFIFNMELQRVFMSAGGIEVTEAIDTKGSTGRFKRRRKVLGNKKHIKEGVMLSLHPLITMKKWPGPKPEK